MRHTYQHTNSYPTKFHPSPLLLDGMAAGAYHYSHLLLLLLLPLLLLQFGAPLSTVALLPCSEDE